jgi:zinc transporter 2
MSYGYHRSEILGALFSTLVIWILTGVLVYMAILRVIDTSFKVDPIPMLVTASCGVVFNIIMYVVLHTKICFKGINLGHHGHSHSGDGHGHGHSHGSSAAAVAATSNHGHSHAGGNHGHSHSEGGHGHSHSHSEARSKSNASNVDFSIPINDNFNLGSTNINGDDCERIIDHDDVDLAEVDVNDSNNINLRAAAIHVIGDFVQSIGVLIASIIIYIDVKHFRVHIFLIVKFYCF